jgi:hypothetical protein
MIRPDVLDLMTEQGGAFNRKLVELYRVADSENSQRLEQAFSDIFTHFKTLANKTKLSIKPMIPLFQISGINEPEALFELGDVYITTGAQQTLQEFNVLPETLLSHHVIGQWSSMLQEDKKANLDAIEQGERVLSTHRLHKADDYDDMVIVRVMTEWDRSCTTILLPKES